MSDLPRWDIEFKEWPTVEPHFCREWDEDEGCYGTNPNHGYSWVEACRGIATELRRMAEVWDRREIDPNSD